jgi:hypothetical protein
MDALYAQNVWTQQLSQQGPYANPAQQQPPQQQQQPQQSEQHTSFDTLVNNAQAPSPATGESQPGFQSYHYICAEHGTLAGTAW